MSFRGARCETYPWGSLEEPHAAGSDWRSQLHLPEVHNGDYCPGLCQLIRRPVCAPSVALQEKRLTGAKAGAIPWEPSQLLAEEQKSLLPSAWGFC